MTNQYRGGGGGALAGNMSLLQAVPRFPHTLAGLVVYHCEVACGKVLLLQGSTPPPPQMPASSVFSWDRALHVRP